MADNDTKALLQPEEKGEVSAMNDDTSEEAINDPSDKLTPEHPRFKDVLARAKEAEDQRDEFRKEIKSLREEMEDIRNTAKQRESETGKDELTADEKYALERIDANLRKRGYLTKEELEKEQRVQNRRIEYQRLSEKHDGHDSYPKFNAEDIEEFAKRNGYGDNYEVAYFAMHRDAIARIDAKKIAKGEVPSSEKPTGGERSIPETELSAEQIANMSPQEWENHRQAVLTGVKQSTK